MIAGQLIVIAIFAGTDAMTFVDTDEYQNGFLIGTLVSVVFMSALVGLVQGSQAALAALFPPVYMGTFMQVLNNWCCKVNIKYFSPFSS